MIRNMDQAFTCLNIQLVNTASLSDVQKEQYCEYFDRCSKCDLSHVFLHFMLMWIQKHSAIL